MRAWKIIALASLLLAVTVAGRELLADWTIYGGSFYGGFDGSAGGGSASCDGSPCVTNVGATAPLASSGGSNPTVSINLDGSIPPGALAANTVGASQVINGSIGPADLADGGVGQGNIAAGAVGPGQIADGGVGQGNIAAGAVGSGQIADGGVGRTNIAAGVVGPAQIGDGGVGNNNLAAAAVGRSNLIDGSVGSITGTNPISATCVLPGDCTISYTTQDGGVRTLISGDTTVSASGTNTLGPFTLASDGGTITEAPRCLVYGTDNVANAEFCCPCGTIRTTDGVSCDYEQTVDAGTFTLRCRNWNSSSSRTVHFAVKGEWSP